MLPIRRKSKAAILLIASLFSLPVLSAQCPSEKVFSFPTVSTDTFTPEQVKQELTTWIRQSRSVHPKFDLVVDYEALYSRVAEIKGEINRPLNQLEVFRLFSRVNSIFADGHHGISYPDIYNRLKRAIKAGDRLFPVEVHISQDFQVTVKKSFGSLAAGTVIASINGVPASEIARTLENRIIGDTTDFRRSLAANRFAELLWQHYGSAAEFEIQPGGKNTCDPVVVEGRDTLMPHRNGEFSFDAAYEFKLMADHRVGYIKLGSFVTPDYEQFYAFTQDAFAQLKAAGSKHLILDLRHNGGGDDTLWIEGIMPYIAQKPWQRMSHFLGWVRDIDDAFPERKGEVAIFDFKGEYQVSEKQSFDGQVYVVTGALSYSSAIMFPTVIRDNELGTIVGERTFARSCQTGMSQYHNTTFSNLLTYTPQHWYNRNSGESCIEGVKADIKLKDNPYNEQAMIEELVSLITAD